MHLHVARVRRNGKVYSYGQLVESYRRDDGMPTQRVIAKLGAMSDLAIENLRTSLRAAKLGKPVIVGNGRPPSSAASGRPVQNLRYLDLAVLHELWRELGLGALLDELIPRGQSEVSAADVVAALAIQRCVDPGSKLYAERWFPRTALPELLGIYPTQFNNTRLHRVLEDLDAACERLMFRLPQLYQQHGSPLASLFLDVTDTRFVGHGPELAEVGKTKEGILGRKVGIVLLCNEHGYPLRWQVIPGKHAESGAMLDVVEAVAGLAWVRDKPIVMDRAMGSSAEIRRLLGHGVQFVTALKVTEIEAYTDRVPHQGLTDLSIRADTEQAIEQASRCVVDAGMQRAAPTLYVLDAGLVERDAAVDDAGPGGEDEDLAREAIRRSRRIRDMVQSGQADSLASAARRTGLSRTMAKRYRQLLRLTPEIQQTLLDGPALGLSIDGLGKVAQLDDAEEQHRAFTRLLAAGPARTRSGKRPSHRDKEKPPPIRVRAVIAFNPERFVDERRQAALALEQVQAFVAALNAKLAHRASRRTKRAVERELEDMLRRRSFLDLYTVELEERRDDSPMRVRLVLDAERWKRRRRYDGFSVLLAHPDVTLSAADLSKLYRAKDAVEKDFQVIKSFVQLRPIWHRTDTKVRAHVAICMLALLLERVLRRKLRTTSAPVALELLASCCINRFEEALYVLTEPDAEQHALLRKLRLERLADEADVTARLRPRPKSQRPLPLRA
jgi:transposase